jgi:S1-C subfamily serine protease
VAADIDSGDSGAALVDQSGVVVGIAYATTRRDAGVAYATRASELQRLLDTADLTREIELPPCA